MKDLVLLGPNINAEALDTFKVVCTPERITTTRQSARCTGVRDDPETRKAVAGLASYWKIDAAFVDPAARLSDFRLLAMDMDSTLISIESLDEVAACAGKGPEVAAITEAAMRGEIADYKESLRRRVAMLEGTDAALLQRVLDDKLRLNPGAEDLIRACQKAGLRTLLVTGGFTFFTDRMRERLGFDYTRSNETRGHQRPPDRPRDRTGGRGDHRRRRKGARARRGVRAPRDARPAAPLRSATAPTT